MTSAFCAVSEVSCMVTIDFKLADMKLESSQRDLFSAEVTGKSVVGDFEDVYLFCKNSVLNICRYLKHFCIKENKGRLNTLY